VAEKQRKVYASRKKILEVLASMDAEDESLWTEQPDCLPKLEVVRARCGGADFTRADISAAWPFFTRFNRPPIEGVTWADAPKRTTAQMVEAAKTASQMARINLSEVQESVRRARTKFADALAAWVAANPPPAAESVQRDYIKQSVRSRATAAPPAPKTYLSEMDRALGERRRVRPGVRR